MLGAPLPVYNEKRAGTDAHSGATPAGKKPISLERSIAMGPGTYLVRGEVNSSFDYNETYPKRKGDVNGQPSLIYSGSFHIGEQAGEISVPLTPEEAEGLTTARSILDSIILNVQVR